MFSRPVDDLKVATFAGTFLNASAHSSMLARSCRSATGCVVSPLRAARVCHFSWYCSVAV